MCKTSVDNSSKEKSHLFETKERDKINPYRIFISYSHSDQKLAAMLNKHLYECGMLPITDHQIRVGEVFSEEIREMIECAHVFMPLVTPSANERLWVQQEIGYAMALHVPVCPVAVGSLPSGMAEHIQGIHVCDINGKHPSDKEVMTAVKHKVTYMMIDDLIRRAPRRHNRQGRYESTFSRGARQELLLELAESAYRNGCRLVESRKEFEYVNKDIWRLRLCGSFSVFATPAASSSSSIWDVFHYDRSSPKDERESLRRERELMEAYTQVFGCDMVIDPGMGLKERKERMRYSMIGKSNDSNLAFKEPSISESSLTNDILSSNKVALGIALRIKLLLEFIKKFQDDDRLRVIMPIRTGHLTTNLVLAGDWFAVEAVVPFQHAEGFERTMFTRHAPTVLNRIAQFDKDFNDFLSEAGLDPFSVPTTKNAKQLVLKELELLLEKIDNSL